MNPINTITIGTETINLPIKTYLSKGDKGLVCRVGRKVFFPDRRCADSLCEGYVIINEVTDKGNYGFFMGRMEQYDALTDEAMEENICTLDLWDNEISVRTSKCGTFLSVRGNYFGEAMYVKEKDSNKLTHAPFPKTIESTLVGESFKGCDFVCKRHHGCTFEELKDKFVRFEFRPHSSIKSIKFISHLFDDAVNSGFMDLRTVQNVNYVDINEDALCCSLRYYSKDEMDELVHVVNKINTEANAAIKSKIKSGKLRLC